MYQLSKPQRLIYDLEKIAGGSINVICGVMLTKEDKTIPSMQAAVNEIFRLNDSLRLRIIEKGSSISQIVADYIPQEIEVLHFESKADLDRYAHKQAQIPFDFHGSLCEIRVVIIPGQSGILVKFHHIVGDAWTIALIGTQFNKLIHGETLDAYSYTDYIDSEISYLQSSRHAKDKAFFLEQFEKCNEVTYLSEDQTNSFSSIRKTFVIQPSEAQHISEYAGKTGVSPFVLFLAAFVTYFSRVKQNTEKFYIGTAVLNRSGVREKNTMGMFVNTVPLLMELDNEKSFADNLSRVKNVAMSALRHQKFNYSDTLAAIRQECGFTEKLYDVILSYQNATITGAKEESTWYHCGAQSESLQIHIDDRDSENIFRLHFDYQTDKFTQDEIERIYSHILNLLFDAIKNTDKKLYQLEMLSPDEKQKILFDYNDTKIEYPRDKCVHTLFEEQAMKTPDKIAVIACDKTLTYRELNEQANRIAHGLIEQGICPGDIVAFALPRDSHLIPTMFGIMKAGAAYLPIDPDYPQDRISYMLEDSGAKYYITQDRISDLLLNADTSNPTVDITSENLCYCIYTSGSTGAPKGVLIRHYNVSNFCNRFASSYQYHLSLLDGPVLSTFKASFDGFSVDSILPLLLGNTVALSSENQLLNADELSDFGIRFKCSSVQGTPSFLQAYMQFSPAFRNFIRQTKQILLAAESISPTLLSYISSQSSATIINGYGPSETTIGASFANLDSENIHIGKPIANTQIYIVDKYMNLVPTGVTGELCIAGDGVGAGYLNRPELTAEKFIDNPFGEDKLYKTGDLAYWREDGNIVYVGRNDFQVKIRGLRIELGEIESVISGVEGISQVAIVVRRVEGDRQIICAFYTETRPVDLDTVKKALQGKLPRYMIPHVFTKMEELPLTSSGKINRNALPEVDIRNLESEIDYVAPITEQEVALVNALRDILSAETISMLDNFFDLGGDSLKAIELTAALEQAGYHVEIQTVFEASTIGELAAQLVEVENDANVVVPTGDIPATDTQLRIYTAQNMSGGTAYNVPYVFKVKHLDPDKLQAAVSKMVQRHEILRTRFENRNGEIMQIEDKEAKCTVEVLDSDDITAFVRPFDLATAPLLRVGYYENTVMVDMHHIITDGTSMPVFLHELNELYMGRDLISEPVQYREFAALKQDYTEAESYWLSVFSDDPPVLEVNTDRTRANHQSFGGAAIYESIPKDLHDVICTKCQQLDITPYTYYMGAFQTFLSKFSGNEDIVVGMPTSGRSGKFLHALGMFVNTVALRTKPEGNKSVRDYLMEVKADSINALTHQVYPYSTLVKKLGIQPGNRNPLFDVMFAYQSEEMTEVIFGDELAELLPVPLTTSKYDFTFNVLPHQDEVVLMVEYCTDLYDEKTLRRFIESYKLLLSQMLEEGKELRELSPITKQERDTLLYKFNDSAVEYPRDKCVHTLFEEQVAKTPDKTAVIACDRTLTYRELNEQANCIAHGLIERGICPGDIVAFALSRDSHLIPTMFGILKAGAAYLPIDPDYPQDRIKFVLKDSNAAYFITAENISSFLENRNISNPAIPMSSESLCYCIYTSGSTGRPKGTLLKHRGIVNLVTNLNIYSDLSNCERIGFMTTITFDVATQEIFTALLNGFTGVLVSERKETGVDQIISNVNDNKVDIIYATPTYFDTLTKTEASTHRLLSTVKVVCLAGEKIYLNHNVASLNNKYHTIIENQYGPVELHVIATTKTLENADYESIGTPIGNNQAYIVDGYMQIVPIGVIGELCIAGDGVGAGYLNRPELTAEKFVDNPFGKGKLYRTGDLAYWREDGNIVYVGRNDFQVKVKGLRIELGEIESAITGVEGISQAVVVVREDKSSRQIICAFYTETQPVEMDTIKKALQKRLPRYMIPHVFTKLQELPLTSSGKINRNALPEVDIRNLESEIDYVAPITEQEVALVNALRDILSAETISMLDNFFDLGGDSLKAIELTAALEQAGYHVGIKTIFESETIGELAGKLVESELYVDEFIPMGDIPATDTQMRIYTAHNLSGGTAYNVPYVFKVKHLDPDKLQAAVSKMVQRHEILRTRFENRDGEIMQIEDKEAKCTVEVLDSDDITAFVRPFDLATAPLLRVGYYENTVMIDMHHIITDGGSMPVFLHELNELYMGRDLISEPVQYRDFLAQKPDYTAAESYWLSVFEEDPPALEINTDYSRGLRQTFNGAAVYGTISHELHESICKRCQELDITPYTYYMAAFHIFLSKFSGNEDIVVGMPTSGRSGKFLRALGMFVNTVVLRTRPEGDKLVNEYLLEVRKASIDALTYQSYPYGSLVKKLGVQPGNRNPLFDVMFAYQSEEMTEIIFGDELAELLPVSSTTSKYDFTFNVLPRQDEVVLMVEYCTDLYDEKTLRRFIESYKLLLLEMLEEGEELRELSPITEQERDKLLCKFNDTSVEYPRDKCVHTLFEEQAAKTPDKSAVIACDKTLTYRELNEQANRIAHGLIEQGVCPGDIVAFALPRDSHLIPTLLGILKTGAAYLPIDPDYPQDRIKFMLNDSNATYFITAENISSFLENGNISNPAIPMSSESLCYCIYTSGSTGRPKGTLLKHRGIVNLVTNLNIYSDLSNCERIGFMTTITFDVATQEIFTALLNGFTGVLVSERKETGVDQIISNVNDNKVDIIYATPTYFDTLTKTEASTHRLLSTVKVVCLAGEKIYLNHNVASLNKKYLTIIENQYGPVELHVIATTKTLENVDYESIGTPIGNNQAYIVDRYMQIVPIGVIGELCIAGDGVGAGYLNCPELTAEKFVNNPFGEGKLYKTGDLAYWREDGNIVYVGRNDFQVKIRGLRIELGEIESAIAGIEGISQAVVVVREDESNRQNICAFYTETQPVELETIKKALQKKLRKRQIFPRLARTQRK